jgi:RNA polymerase sigma-70 factor, ECF subfamily
VDDPRARDSASSDRGRSQIAEFVQLTEPHHRHLYGIALSLCRDADQAADLTQEALIRAFEAFDRFQVGAPVLPWLRRILRNLFLDSFKTGRARHEVTESAIGSTDDPFQIEVADERDDPLTHLERSEHNTWLAEEIAALSPDHQQVLNLCVMQDLSFEDAAEMTRIPVGTIASRLARARSQLRARMLKRARQPKTEGALLADSDDPLARRPSRPAKTSR